MSCSARNVLPSACLRSSAPGGRAPCGRPGKADGVQLDAGLSPDDVRAALDTAGAGEGFLRTGHVHVADLGDDSDGIGRHAAAGREEVIVVPPGDDPDVEPLLRAH